MKEYKFRVKQRFFFAGKTYKKGEIILNKYKSVSREISHLVEFIGVQHG